MAQKSSKLNIFEWDPSKFKIDTVTALIGRRGTGKSTIMQELCYHIRDQIDYVVGFSPTEEVHSDFGNIIPRSLVYNEMDIGVMEDLIKAQKRSWKRKPSYNLLFIFDDCGYDKKKFRNQTIGNLFKNGRHYHITIIFSLQYAKDIGPDLRGNIDYLFACQDASVKNRQILHQQFFGQFTKFRDFAFTMDRCTENFECIVCDGKTSKTNTIKDQVFYFKARLSIRQIRKKNPDYVYNPSDPVLPNFRCGAKWMWKLNKVRFQEEDDGYSDEGLPEFCAPRGKGKHVEITEIQKHDKHGQKIKN